MLDRTYVLGLGAFTALTHFEFNLLVVKQRLRRCLDVRAVDEQILAPVIRLDEPIPLLVIEELHCTCSQNTNSQPGIRDARTLWFPALYLLFKGR